MSNLDIIFVGYMESSVRGIKQSGKGARNSKRSLTLYPSCGGTQKEEEEERIKPTSYRRDKSGSAAAVVVSQVDGGLSDMIVLLHFCSCSSSASALSDL